MFQVGDEILYVNPEKETFHGRILDIKNRVKIRYNHFTGLRDRWVSPDSIQTQETSRCAHNDECGWCDDTGKCIYL